MPGSAPPRPRPHRNDDGIAGQPLAVDDKPIRGRSVRRPGDARDVADLQPGAAVDRRRHHTLGEFGRVDLGRSLGRAEPGMHGGIRAEPVRRLQATKRTDVAAGARDHP